jgi:hypothetical protein
VGGGVIVMDSCTGKLRFSGRLIVYCTGVGVGIMVMKNCKRIVR